ncbi:hypothetical protein [Methanobrevibacter sp.]|uniref:hypothetical protein n=1 Tax=Methanobrevibacter sp. TaxID=66852 RepID=UPI0025D1F8BD|nr:hypothetical protein [Methanobrevibacter sp.]MBR4448034.1 hypothetical protein [Methanobrevibacter sp.]
MPDGNIRNPPSNDAYPIVSTLFVNKRFNKHEILINSLSLTILDLIKKDQIKCEINWEKSHSVGKKLTETDLEVMKNITLRIANKGELKTSEFLVIKLLKAMNKNKKFNLKDMLKQSKNSAIANKFGEGFMEFKTAIENENDYTSKDYKDILVNGKFTREGKELQKEWGNFQKYLKSQDLTEKYPPESIEENSSQIIYGACFNMEKDVLKLRENNSILCDFIDKDGYKLLNIIFNNALSHVSEKHKGNGIFYGVNDKYTIPGGV